MSTQSQILANRENAQHSTGPTTDAGKARCSQNGLKHGLASEQLIIPGESEEEFNALLHGLLAEHKPATLTETLLIQDMAKYQWLADRAIYLQNTLLVVEISKGGLVPAGLGLFIRYHNTHKRAFEKAFATFNAMKKLRLSEIGSASHKASQPAAKPTAPTTPAAETHHQTAQNHAPHHPPAAATSV